MLHSAVGYLWPDARQRFSTAMRQRPEVLWISNEAPGIFSGLVSEARPPAGVARACLVVGVGGSRLAAIADPHGAWLRWLAG